MEVEERERNTVDRRIREAHLPGIKTLDECDFTVPASKCGAITRISCKREDVRFSVENRNGSDKGLSAEWLAAAPDFDSVQPCNRFRNSTIRSCALLCKGACPPVQQFLFGDKITFSRAFGEFATAGLPTRVQEALVRNTMRKECFDYVARDSTAIEGREHLPEDYLKKQRHKQKAAAALQPQKNCYQKYPGKRSRAKPGPHKRARAKERGPRLQRQQHMTLDEMLAELPKECSLGAKTSSKGHQQYWRGYKLHWDVAAAGRIPLSCVLTSASVHDSQVAIPLMHLSAQRTTWRCDVMDSAYDAQYIRAQAQKLGHKTLIQPATRTGLPNSTTRLFSEEDKQRFRKRTVVEQLNARLKDEFGGRVIYLRGASKIMAHLMFGVVALTVDQLLRLAP